MIINNSYDKRLEIHENTKTIQMYILRRLLPNWYSLL